MAMAFWNLFLGIVPVFLGAMFARGLDARRREPARPRPSRAVVLLFGLAWLAFLPNAAYMLTDFRHYLFDEPWREIHGLATASRDALFASAAWAFLFLGYGVTGLVLMTAAVRPVHRAVAARGHGPWRWGIALFFLCSLGVYVGLIYRLNSWDFAARPGRVVWAVLDSFSRPRSALAIAGFAAFLGAAYVVLDAALDGILARLRRLQRSRAAAPSPSPSPSSTERA